MTRLFSKAALAGLIVVLAACGGNDVTYRLEQDDPARQNTIGITNAGGQTHTYGSIGASAQHAKQ